MANIDKNMKEIETKQSLRELENDYVNNVLDNLDSLVKEKETEVATKLTEYKRDCTVTRMDKNGHTHTFPNLNPVLIKNYFFKSINPLPNVEPKYTAEKLGIVWQIFNDMVMKINQDIGDFTPNITTFCEFAGITVATFNNYKKSADDSMRIIVEKIDDSCFNSNVSLAQLGKLKERTTLYRMKSEQKRVESEQPEIHIHTGDEIDLAAMMSRLNELNKLNNKQKGIEVESKEI